MRSSTTAGLIVGFSVLLIPMISSGTLINGSFELGPGIPGGSSHVTVGGGSNAITGWTVTGSSIDVFGAPYLIADGLRAVDLDGAFSTGGIQQNFTTLIGQKYTVSFDLSGNLDGSPRVKNVEVSVDSFLQTFSHDTAGQTRQTLFWQPISFDFIASGSNATLGFRSLSPVGNSFGAFIDNVNVSTSTPGPVPAPEPEPSTILLLGTGLAGLVSWKYRKKN